MALSSVWAVLNNVPCYPISAIYNKCLRSIEFIDYTSQRPYMLISAKFDYGIGIKKASD
jgi:hypothetical protein